MTLPELDVRPGEDPALPTVHLTIPKSYLGKELPIKWRLTSSEVDSWAAGTISYLVAADVLSVKPPLRP